MSWSYTGPTAGVFPTVKDAIRFEVGDTIASRYSLSDEEIEAVVSILESVNGVTYTPSDVAVPAATTADRMADRIDRETVTSKKVGATSITRQLDGRAQALRDLAARLRGGGSQAAMSALIAPASQPEAVFTIGMTDAS